MDETISIKLCSKVSLGSLSYGGLFGVKLKTFPWQAVLSVTLRACTTVTQMLGEDIPLRSVQSLQSQNIVVIG